MSRTGFPSGTNYAGTYLIRGEYGIPGGYIDEVYEDVECPSGCNFLAGTPINVVNNGPGTIHADITGINIELAKGGTITGNITDAIANPIAGVTVKAYQASGDEAANSVTNILGNYTLKGLPLGDYYVFTENDFQYLDEVHDGSLCEPFCNPVTTAASPIVVVSPAPAIGPVVDFQLSAAGTISGTVSSAAKGGGIAGVDIEVYDALGNFISVVQTAVDGSYALSSLGAGEYHVRSRNSLGLVDQLNDGTACVAAACRVRNSDPIVLSEGGVVSNVDLTLSIAGRIVGEVTDQDSISPMEGVSVNIYDARGVWAGLDLTDNLGAYAFGGLGSGDYYAVTRGTADYIDEAYDEVVCPAACDSLNGSALAVVAGDDTIADFDLSAGAAISGNVTGDGQALVGVLIQVYNDAGIPIASTATNASGNYEVQHIPNGDLYVRTQNDLGFADQLWSALTCVGYCDITNGTAVQIVGGADQGSINFALGSGGGITGTVTGPGNVAVSSVELLAIDSNGFVVGSGLSDHNGQYSIGGLITGQYQLRSLNTIGLVDEVYNNQSCSPTPCLLTNGNSVTVSTGSSSNNIDFSLVSGIGISGTATDPFGNPLLSGAAILFDSNGDEVMSVAMENGFWEFQGVVAALYYVVIKNDLGLVDQLFLNQDCPGASCDVTAGTPIDLTTKGSGGLSGFDLTLPVGNTISGTLTGVDINPIAYARIYIFDSSGVEAGQAITDGLGEYTSEGSFPDGTYYLATSNGVVRGVNNGEVNQLWPGLDCPLDCDPTAGDAIQVAGQAVTGVDLQTTVGGSISGLIEDSNSSALVYVAVEVYEDTGSDVRLAGRARSNSLGEFTIDGLPTGTFYLRTVDTGGYADSVFGGDECEPDCDVSTGTPLALAEGQDLTGITIALSVDPIIFVNGFE